MTHIHAYSGRGVRGCGDQESLQGAPHSKSLTQISWEPAYAITRTHHPQRPAHPMSRNLMREHQQRQHQANTIPLTARLCTPTAATTKTANRPTPQPQGTRKTPPRTPLRFWKDPLPPPERAAPPAPRAWLSGAPVSRDVNPRAHNQEQRTRRAHEIKQPLHPTDGMRHY